MLTLVAIVVGSVWAAVFSSITAWYYAEEIGDPRGLWGWLLIGLSLTAGTLLFIDKAREVWW